MNGLNGDNTRTAVKTAAVAAGSSAVVLVARHALARRQDRTDLGEALSAGVDAAWQAAREAVMPAVGDAASAAGRYVAESAPDIVRDSILPHFIDGYQEAHERRSTRGTDDHDRSD